MVPPTKTLLTGEKIPVIGLGTSRLVTGTAEVVQEAIEIGYRHFDTAKMYGNEKEIGRGIAQSNIARDEIFLTTKVWPTDQGYDGTLQAIDASLERLGMSYVDLYLVHWPVDSAQSRKETWKAMEEIQRSGKAKSIGVSNFDEMLLDELESYADISPSVNQIEMHPFLYRKSLVDLCQIKGMVVTDYSPLVKKRHMDHPVIQKIALSHEKTAAQVLLRWGIQHGCVVIPKASTQEHLRENIDIFKFDLTASEMHDLDTLNQNESVV